MEEKDHLNYLLGVYFKLALESTVCNQLSGGKGEKAKYPEKPLLQEVFMTDEERADEELRKAIANEMAWQQNDIRRGLKSHSDN